MSRLDNIAAITLAASFLLLITVLGRSYYLSRRLDSRSIPLVKTGEKVRLPGFNAGAAQSTLVLVLSRQCRYCLDDLPFYKQLSAVRRSSGDSIHLLAVLPERTTSAREFLANAGIGADDVVSMSPRSLGVQLLPTLLLVDGEGKLQQYWVGAMDRKQQQQVFSVLRKSCPACSIPEAGDKS